MSKQKNKQSQEQKRAVIYTKPLIKKIIIFCIALEISLLIIDAIFNYRAPGNARSLSLLIDISRESGLGGWFSSVQTLLSGFTLLLIFFRARMDSTEWKETVGWLVLSIFFIYMAIDDGIEIHEQCANCLGLFNLPQTSPWFIYLHKVKKFPTYYWQMLFGPFFITMGIFMLYFLWKKIEGLNLRKYIIIGLICFAIAVGMDFFEGLYNSHVKFNQLLHLNWERHVVIHFLRATEEFLEMMGNTLLWYVFLSYLSKILNETRITFREEYKE